MPSKHSDSGNTPAGKSTLVKVANTTHLYKLALPGDKPSKPTGSYYAFIKRGRKQFRRSLKTTHRKLADRRLRKLLDEIGNLDTSADTTLTFEQVARKWVELTSHTLNPPAIHSAWAAGYSGKHGLQPAGPFI